MDTTKLFDAALGLTSPWRVEAVRFAPGTVKGGGTLEMLANTQMRPRPNT